jgi:hypothetical protein
MRCKVAFSRQAYDSVVCHLFHHIITHFTSPLNVHLFPRAGHRHVYAARAS